jgi:hypothetical protein
MRFSFHSSKEKEFKKVNRITFSCDLETLKLIKKHSCKFNYCQSDLIKKAVSDFIQRLETEEQNKEKKNV